MRTNLSRLPVLAAAIVCVFVAGCYDTKQEIILNPDGSGKMVIESTFAQTELLFNGDRRAPPDQAPTAYIRKLIQDAQGVDAWRDVSCRELEDGRLAVRGTAYFRDCSKVTTGPIPFLGFKVTREPGGDLTLGQEMDTSRLPLPILSTSEPVTAESIQQERKQFRAAQPWLAATLGTMKKETIVRFPGVVRRASNFQTNGPQSLRLRFDGARLVPALEQRFFGPESDQQRQKAGSVDKFLNGDYLFNEKVYGQRAPIFAIIAPGEKPLFDYEAEVAEARKSFATMASEMGLTETLAQRFRPVAEGEPAKIKVIGIGWRFDGEQSPGIAFGGPQQSYTLSLMAELPGTVLSVNNVQVTRAATLEGVLLKLQQRSWHGWSRTLDPYGRTNVSFDVSFASPAIDSKGFAEVSGVLECTSAENLRTVELISGKLAAGAKGTEFGARLDYVGSNDADVEKLVLRTSIAPEQILSLKVIDDASRTMNLEIRGRMGVGKDYTYTCVARRFDERDRVRRMPPLTLPLPRSGKLVAEVLLGSQTLRIPFAVTNLTLMGQPLAAK